MLIKEIKGVSCDLLNVFSDKSLLHYTDLPFCTSIDSADFTGWIESADRISWAGYENEKFIGFVSAHLVKKHLTASITIVVLELFQGNGFAGLLLSHAVEYLFSEGYYRIEAQICTENLNSVKLFTSAGFTNEGILHKNFLIDGVLYDSYMFALLRKY